MRRNVIVGMGGREQSWFHIRTSPRWHAPFRRLRLKPAEGRQQKGALKGGVALCALLLAQTLASYAGPLSQRTESKTEMAAAKFPKLVAEYLRDLHSRHPT